MNGYSTEYDESFLEDYESIDGEYDEAAPSRRFRPFQPKMAKGGNLYKSRPQTGTGNYVTQTQLEAALTRVGGQIKTNAEATEAVNKRVNGTGVRLDEEIARRRKADEGVRKQIQSSSQMSILPLLLQTAPTITVKDASGQPAALAAAPVGAKNTVSITASQSSTTLLPLVLLMGMGGLGGDGKGSDDNNMMLLMMVLLMSQQTK
jgi:hypothetical protein